jgi:hypothetical protein
MTLYVLYRGSHLIIVPDINRSLLTHLMHTKVRCVGDDDAMLTLILQIVYYCPLRNKLQTAKHGLFYSDNSVCMLPNLRHDNTN